MGANWCILVVTTVILAVVFDHSQQNLELQWNIPYIVAVKVVDSIILNLMGLVFLDESLGEFEVGR
jgi:hypothetical protein